MCATSYLACAYVRSTETKRHKEGPALRTETIIPYDFQINKGLNSLPALRKIGFTAKRRLLHLQQLSHDCMIGEDAFLRVNDPVEVDGQWPTSQRVTFCDPNPDCTSVLNESNADFRPS